MTVTLESNPMTIHSDCVPKFIKDNKTRIMKRIVQIVFSCSVLIVLPLIFVAATLYPRFHVRHFRWDRRTCTRYYVGVSKGTIWENGEWHHYVDFEVDDAAPVSSWKVVAAPVDSSVWREYSASFFKRVAYRWPSNWWDPFPASAWKICLLSS